jgi:hypothetical protein
MKEEGMAGLETPPKPKIWEQPKKFNFNELPPSRPRTAHSSSVIIMKSPKPSLDYVPSREEFSRPESKHGKTAGQEIKEFDSLEDDGIVETSRIMQDSKQPVKKFGFLTELEIMIDEEYDKFKHREASTRPSTVRYVLILK